MRDPPTEVTIRYRNLVYFRLYNFYDKKLMQETIMNLRYSKILVKIFLEHKKIFFTVKINQTMVNSRDYMN